VILSEKFKTNKHILVELDSAESKIILSNELEK